MLRAVTVTPARRPATSRRPADVERRDAGRRQPPAVDAVCPYLAAADAGWRSLIPDRELTCTALRPAAAVALDKQRRLCATPDHAGCATFIAATEAVPGGTASRWAITRTTPVVVDHGRLPLGVPALTRAPRTNQFVLGVLMMVAFAVAIVARFGVSPRAAGLDVPSGSPSGSALASAASPFVVALPTPVPSTAAPIASPTGVPTPAPTDAPTATPQAPSAPPSFASWTVRSGDTLSAIAGRFGTTARAIADANGIEDPRRLRIGQVLRIPLP